MTMNPPGKRPSNYDIQYWMGRVDGQLSELVNLVRIVTDRVDKIECQLDDLCKETAQVVKAEEGAEETHITFSWMVEKALLPIVMMLVGGVISWILARGLP